MEPSRLQNIFEQIFYISLRKEFTKRLTDLGRNVIQNANVTPEEAIEILRQFVNAAFQEALCKLTPEDFTNSTKTPAEPHSSETATGASSSANPPSPAAPEPEEDLEAKIAEHLLGLRDAAQKLVTQGGEFLDRSLDGVDEEIQVVIGGTATAIKGLSQRLKQRFQSPSDPPSPKGQDPQNPSNPPKGT